MATNIGKDNALKGCIMIVDILLLVTVVLSTYFIEDYYYHAKLSAIKSMPALLAIYIFSFLASYSFYPAMIHERIVKSEDIARRVTITSLFMFLFVSLLLQLTRIYPSFPRIFLLSTFVVFTPLLFAERLLLRRIFTRARSNKRNQKNILIIGGDPMIYELYKVLNRPMYGYNIIGAFYDGEACNQELADIKLGNTDSIFEWLAKNNDISEIYGYLPKEKQDKINLISKFCDNHLIRFYYVPVLDVFSTKHSMSFIDDIPVIAKREEPLSKPANKFIKRLFDLFVSTIVLVFFFPWLYIFVAIMIKIKSPGPVFFKQERTGLDGKVFLCYKFRTMKVNADSDRVQATKDDPRKYPFGNFMRKTNIDEIPQFINVFKGEMSLVGPRPHMLLHTEEYSKLINLFMVRHLAKPGITGLAQVTGFRGETKYIDQMEGRVKKDIEYIENWTFFLDIKIMIKTITNMFGGEKMAY